MKIFKGLAGDFDNESYVLESEYRALERKLESLQLQMAHVYLSRRNLNALLVKLDGIKKGIPSRCTIIKRDTVHKKYPSTCVIAVTALEDDEYYDDRPAGEMREDREIH